MELIPGLLKMRRGRGYQETIRFLPNNWSNTRTGLTGMKSAATETSAGRHQCLKNSRGGWIGTNCFILFLKYIFLNIQNNGKTL